MLFVLALILIQGLFADMAIPTASDIESIGHADTIQEIKLTANLNIPDDGELSLPIEIPKTYLEIDGEASPKVVSVSSPHADGTIGVGEEVDIHVTFTSDVDVTGSPALELKTGCHDILCQIHEVQRFTCAADSGKFSLTFDSKTVHNIPYDATPNVLENYLLRLTNVEQISVEYNTGNHACRSEGNEITITFISVNLDGTNGDLPELTTSALNTGGDGTFLVHGSAVVLTATATEVIKGQKQIDRKATYMDKLNANTLRFQYVVQNGDDSQDLEYTSTDALDLGDSSTIRLSGTEIDADITLPVPFTASDWSSGRGSSLAYNNDLVVDVSTPTITDVTCAKEDGAYGIGESIMIDIRFSFPVIVSGSPYVILETGPIDRVANYESTQEDGSVLRFEYVVQSSDASSDLEVASPATSFMLNSGTVRRFSDTPETAANVTFPTGGNPGSLSYNKDLVIDVRPPTVKSIIATSGDATYAAGDVVRIAATFSAPVAVTAGTPSITLSTGSVDLFPGEFVFSVPTDGNAKHIKLPHFDHGLTTELVVGVKFQVGSQIMTGVSVSGDIITMEEDYTGTAVVFQDIVTGSTPQVSISTPGTRLAIYVSGSGSDTLLFDYTVQRGDVASDLDIASTTALALNGGAIQRVSDTPTTNADLTLPSPGATGSLAASSAVVVNTDAPTVTGVSTSIPDGVYRSGEVIDITVTFSAAVTVFNTATLLMDVNAIERYGFYLSGSGTTDLIFRYTVASDESTADLNYDGVNALSAGYGASVGYIRRSSTSPVTNAILTLPANAISSTRSIVIDQTAPYVISVETDAIDGSYGAGDTINLHLVFSEAVNVVSAASPPSLDVSTGKAATYFSGTGTETLVFVYTIGIGDSSADLATSSTTSLDLNGGTIRNTASNDAVLVLPSEGTSKSLSSQHQVVIDTTTPAITMVSSYTVDGEYGVGQEIDLWIQFDKQIIVTGGVPSFVLETGDTDQSAVYKGADETRLYFSYTVQAGDSSRDLDYAHTHSLVCLDESGINKDSGKHASTPMIVEHSSKLYATWSETTVDKAQIRVVVFNGNAESPSWTFVDGNSATVGLNKATDQDGVSPVLVSGTLAESKMYIVWSEVSGTTSKQQIRVAVYGDNDAAPVWTFVDLDTVAAGINKASTQDATYQDAVITSNRLYIAWQEHDGTRDQIRVSRYGGNDGAPSWTFVDGDHATNGINRDATKAASSVKLVAYNANQVACVWIEDSGTAQQVRGSILNDDGVTATWTVIDGNGVTGINVDTSKDAYRPNVAMHDGKLYLAWTEDTATNTRIYVKVFNGDTVTPAWSTVDAGTGLNFDTSKAATDCSLFVHGSSLYGTWTEIDASGNILVRSAVYNGNDASPSWTFVDSNAALSNINDDSTHDAFNPVGISMTGVGVVLMWSEEDDSAVKQVRVSKYYDTTAEQWTSLTYGCIRRLSASPVTVAALNLPQIGRTGSLSDSKHLHIDTTAPFITKVAALSTGNRDYGQAQTIQTIDISAESAINAGGFRLKYKDYLSSCISWDADADTTADSLKELVQDITELSLAVDVAKDTSAFTFGHRYSITFTDPVTGVIDLAIDRTGCDLFSCDSDASDTCVAVVVNEPYSKALDPGVVDIGVYFSKDIVASNSPVLSLETRDTDRDAVWTSASIVQSIDVGVSATSSLLGGEYKLSYDGTQSRCIDFSQADSIDASSLKSALLEITEIATIGIEKVTKTSLGNGFRYNIHFNAGSPAQITVVSSNCMALSGNIQTIDIYAGTTITAGSYKLRHGSLESSCIEWNAPATGEGSMEEAIEAMGQDNLKVSVYRDPSFVTNGYRYYVEFEDPSRGYGETSFEADATGCTTFVCGGPDCTDEELVVNSQYDVVIATTNIVPFRYTIQGGDLTSALDYASSAALTGTFKRFSSTPTTDSSITLPQPGSAVGLSASSIIIDAASPPTVTAITSAMSDATYGAGDIILLQVVFSEAVVVAGEPHLILDSSNIGLAYGSYSTGSGTTTLVFTYVVGDTDSSNDLDAFSTSSLKLNGGSIRKNVGGRVDASLILPVGATANSLSQNKAINIDTTAPSITSVTSAHADNAAEGYGVGETIDIQVQFSRDVVVTGTPSMVMETGDVDRSATFSLAGRTQFIDVGTQVEASITAGQFQIYYGTELTDCIDFDDVTSLETKLEAIDAINDLGITISKTTLHQGHRFTVVFGATDPHSAPLELVVVQPSRGSLCELFASGSSNDLNEVFVQRSTASLVTFRYNVEEGDSNDDLDYIDGSIALNGGTIRHLSHRPTTDASLVLPAAGGANSLSNAKDIKIDSTLPSVNAVAFLSSSDTYGVGYPPTASPGTARPGQVVFTIEFTKSVTVAGTPQIELQTGSTSSDGTVIPNRQAIYTSGTGSTTLTFVYTVQEGDSSSDLDFATANAFSFDSGAHISRKSTLNSQTVDTTLPIPGLANVGNVVISTNTQPAVSSVSSTHDDGTFGLNEEILIQAEFSKPVRLLSGLNQNLLYSARNPVAVELNSKLYFAWSEDTSSVKSVVAAVYDDSTETLKRLEGVNGRLNRQADQDATKPALVTWNSKVYMAWEEAGSIFIDVFNGNDDSPVWNSIPSTPLNRVNGNPASSPSFAVHNNYLYIFWSEKSGADQISQIRVAQYNNDDSRPIWTFQDGNSAEEGVNINSKEHAYTPRAAVFRGRLYLTWTEMDSDVPIVRIARFDDNYSSDKGTGPWLIVATSLNVNSKASAYDPQLQVTNPGTLDAQLHVVWQEQQGNTDVHSIIHAILEPSDDTWRVIGVIGSTTLNGATPVLLGLSANLYCAWIEYYGTSNVVKVAHYDTNPVSPAWVSFTSETVSNLNHNPLKAAGSPFLSKYNSNIGLLWQEHDSVSFKIRGRLNRGTLSSAEWEELPSGTPYLLMETGATDGIALSTDRSGVYSTTLTFKYIVGENHVSSDLEYQSANAIVLNGGTILDSLGQNVDLTLLPGSSDTRSLSYSKAIVIDTSVPTVTDVNTALADGTYGAGQVIDINVVFSAKVIALFGSSDQDLPYLVLENPVSGPSHATLLSGNATSTLVFRYIVKVTDPTQLLRYSDTYSLALLHGAKIRRLSTVSSVDVNARLPVPGEANSLSSNSQIQIDTTAPRVTSVSSSNTDDTYYCGDTLSLLVTFSAPVEVFQMPVLLLDLGVQRKAVYTSGNEANVLVFEYIIQSGDVTGDLNVYDTRSDPAISTVVEALRIDSTLTSVNSTHGITRMATIPTTPVDMSIPGPEQSNSLKSNKAIVVNSDVPYVQQVTVSNDDGTYGIGQTLSILVVFSAPVAVTGTPELILSMGRNVQCAEYSTGSGTTTLTFVYTIQKGDKTARLDYATENSLRLYRDQAINRPIVSSASSTTSIRRQSSNPTLDANLKLALPGDPTTVDGPYSIVGSGKNIAIRADGLGIVQVKSLTASGTYHEAEEILIDVVFNDIVTVTGGAPFLELNAQAGSKAVYDSGSGSTTLRFKYTVLTNDEANPLQYDGTNALKLSGSDITGSDAIGIPLILPLPGNSNSFSGSATLVIDTAQPTVTAVSSSTADGTYGIGDVIVILIQFSARVQIDGANPTLELETGDNDRTAVYVSGDATNTLLFHYTIVSGDTSSDLDYSGTDSLTGTLKAASTTPTTIASAVLLAPSAEGSLSYSSNIVISTTAPTVTKVTSLTPDGTYRAGDKVYIFVHFSASVVVSGTVTLTLETTGDKNQAATYIGGTGTSILRFLYTVESGDVANRLDYTGTTALSGDIKRKGNTASTQVATLTLPAPGVDGSLGFAADLRIDNAAPYVTAVSSSLDDGSYGALHSIPIELTFSEVVIVTGMPQLRLSSSSARAASYTSGSGTNTLVFTYMVQPGDLAFALEYDGIYALVDPDASSLTSIKSSAGFLVSRALPTPGETGSLSKAKRIYIDTTKPKVIRVRSSTADGTYGVGQAIDILMDFSSSVVVTGTPYLLLETGSTDRQASYISGSGTATLTFQYIVQDGDASDDLDYKSVCSSYDLLTESNGYWSYEEDDCIELSEEASALFLNGGSIKRDSTTPTTEASLDLPMPSSWPFMRKLKATTATEYESIISNELAFDKLEMATKQNSNVVVIITEKDSRIIFSNGIPNHSVEESVKAQNYLFEINRYPTLAATSSSTESGGIVGIMLDGVPLRNADLSATGGSLITGMDSCGGIHDETGAYSYVTLPTCYLDTLEATDVVGYALDGYPIYKSSWVSGLDECNGAAYAQTAGYHYVLNNEDASIGRLIKCFQGEYSTADSNPILKTDEIAAIQGLEHFNFKSLTAVTGQSSSDANPWINPDAVKVVYTEDQILVYSTGIPSGEFGPFPNKYNTHQVTEQNYLFQIPRHPLVQEASTALPQGSVGVFLDGIPFDNALASNGEDITDPVSTTYEAMDKCNGHVNEHGSYHIHGSPDCLLDALGDTNGRASPLIGYALDGFPLYGPYAEDGNLATDLDACNGRTDADGNYRYHVTATKPYTIGCFRGSVNLNADTSKLDATNDFFRSLSYSSNLRIDTSSPQVEQVTTSKLPGVYVAGETVDIRVKFSAPVQVSDGGQPYVELQVGETPGQAVYDSTTTTSSTLAFLYTISRGDVSSDLNYISSTALNLNGATILRQSTTPSTAASTTFVSPNVTTSLGHKLTQIESVQVVMRGLYHQHAQDLKVELIHHDRKATVIEHCCGEMTFGEPDELSKDNIALKQDATGVQSSGIGYEYGFEDLSDLNLARSGRAVQSSTAYGGSASRAIDGIRNGKYSQNSVTHTAGQRSRHESTSQFHTPWWQVRLASPEYIGTIKLWNRQQEKNRNEVQLISIDASVVINEGTFRLSCTNGGSTHTTDSIHFNAVAMIRDEDGTTASGTGKGESIQAKLTKLNNIGDVKVLRSVSNARGGYSWSITFITDPGNLDPLVVETNAIPSSGSTIFVSTLVEGNDNKWYNYHHEMVELTGRLFPCWVMVYDEHSGMAFDSLEKAKEQAIYKVRLTKDQRETIIKLPSTIRGQYVRVQLDTLEIPASDVYLSIAEVEVFKLRSRALSHYDGGSPISAASYPGALLWTPEESFAENFAQMDANGLWYLRFSDSIALNTGKTTYGQPQHGSGGLSDWILIIKNKGGSSTTYYMDISARIETLPHYGDLYVSLEANEREYLDRDTNGWLDETEARRYLVSYVPGYSQWDSYRKSEKLREFMMDYETFGGIPITFEIGEEKPRAPCLDTCEDTYGTSSYLDLRSGGDVAGRNRLRNQRIVRYAPRENYLGRDAFRYSIQVGNEESETYGTVNIRVMVCNAAGGCQS